jgi:hypothetical protein
MYYGNRCVGVTSESLRDTSGGEILTIILTHTRWTGGMGHLRRGKWITDERFVGS